MGMFDEVHVSITCPYCGEMITEPGQTKDLDNAMWTFTALPKDWNTTKLFGKKFRIKIPVSKEYPYDKSAKVWKNQAEYKEAQARIPARFTHLKSISLIFDCHRTKCAAWAAKRDLIIQNCVSGFGRIFGASIPVRKRLLINAPYKIIKTDAHLPYKKVRGKR